MPPEKIEDRLTALESFAAVARRLRFAAAAEELGISASALSRRISQLEASLGTRLFQRTTRQVSLTEAGAVFLRYVTEALSHIADGQAAVSDFTSEPIGRLRVTLPNLFGQLQVAPRLPEFLRRYPKVQLELSFSDRFIDLVSEGCDVAVRIGTLENSGLVARKLGTNRRVLCASPDYLERFGEPATPEELVHHACLQFRPVDSDHHWRLQQGDKTVDVATATIVIADNAEALRHMAVAGCGITLMANFIVGDDLKAGRLVRILSGWAGAESAIWAVYPNARFLPLKVRAFIDFLVDEFGGIPPWDF